MYVIQGRNKVYAEGYRTEEKGVSLTRDWILTMVLATPKKKGRLEFVVVWEKSVTLGLLAVPVGYTFKTGGGRKSANMGHIIRYYSIMSLSHLLYIHLDF